MKKSKTCYLCLPAGIIILLFMFFSGCKKDNPADPVPAAPSEAPTIIPGDGKLEIRWYKVQGAVSYEVWMHTSDDCNKATLKAENITDTACIITGLQNGDTYYVWVKARNKSGAGNFSQGTGAKCGAVQSKILFVSDRDGNPEIYVMNADGSNQVRLTNNPAYDSEPAWSPDRKKIVFVSTRGSGKYRLYTMNADGSDQTAFPVSGLQNQAINGEFLGPAWSYDGKYIAFSSSMDYPKESDYHQCYLIGASGGTSPFSVTNSAEDFNGGRPSWAPDGRLVYVSSRGDNGTHLWVATQGTSGLSRTKLPIADGVTYPDWSPDGAKIAYIDFDYSGVSKSIISVYDVLTHDIKQLYSVSFPYSCHKPAWSPDCKKIVFASTISGTYQIYSMDADGKNIQQLTSEGSSNVSPDW